MRQYQKCTICDITQECLYDLDIENHNGESCEERLEEFLITRSSDRVMPFLKGVRCVCDDKCVSLGIRLF